MQRLMMMQINYKLLFFLSFSGNNLFASSLIFDFFIIEPNAKINDDANKLLPENERKNNSLFDLAALLVRVGLPSLWVYNWGSAYQSADPIYQKKLKQEMKKNQENTPLSNNLFNIKLVKINF